MARSSLLNLLPAETSGEGDSSKGSSVTQWMVGALVVAVVLAGCTTFAEPTTCVPGSTSCAGIADARFCQHVAVSVEGADCPDLGIAEAKPFCVVQSGACLNTTYAVEHRDCRILEYDQVRDSARAECPPGAPMFVSR